jgi:hypothetical protein
MEVEDFGIYVMLARVFVNNIHSTVLAIRNNDLFIIIWEDIDV